ncbi:MAG: hypothetical protein H6599_11280 [Flavobacteriales bacterium]|nr:hypothetical protein [Flavobacteriales bacterium]
MKKVLLSLGVVATLAMTSCGGGSAEDIKVEDLKDACGCVDAMNVVADDVLATVDKFDSEEELEKDEEAVKKIDALEEKFEEIEDHCKDKLEVKKSDIEACDGFKTFVEKMEKIEEKL